MDAGVTLNSKDIAGAVIRDRWPLIQVIVTSGKITPPLASVLTKVPGLFLAPASI